MSIVSACPHCGTQHKFADDSKVGRKIRCKECQAPFAIEAKKSAGPAKKRRSGPPGGLPPKKTALKTKPKKKPKSDAEKAKKKRPKKRKKSAGKSPALIGGLCVLALGLLFVIPMLFPEEKPIEPPASYAEFTHDVNREFKIEYPEGWTVESGGVQGKPVWAKFKHPDDDDVRIQVKSSMGASAIGDIAKNLPGGGLGGAAPEMEEDLAPVATVHSLMHDQFAGEYSDYSEQSPQKIETGFGDTRVSEFTASGSFGSKIRGMRASMLGLNLQFTVICDCPEKDWEVCKPVFEKVIKSMSRG